MTAGRQSVSTVKDWCTPPSIIRSVKETFGGSIGLDPCSNEFSMVGAMKEYSLPFSDGLRDPWDAKTIYVNPPYGSDRGRGTRIIDWFERIVDANRNGSEVIALVPVATNTKHWKEHVFPVASGICFLAQPRLRFYTGGEENRKGAPMACAIIYYGQDWNVFAEAFREHGAVLPLNEVKMPLKA